MTGGAIGLVTTTAAGRQGASRLEALGETRTYDVRDLPRAFVECSSLVVFLATGFLFDRARREIAATLEASS